MNGQQRFLHDVVDPGHRAEPGARKLPRRRCQQDQQRGVGGLIASLRQPHQGSRLALLLGRHGATPGAEGTTAGSLKRLQRRLTEGAVMRLVTDGTMVP